MFVSSFLLIFAAEFDRQFLSHSISFISFFLPQRSSSILVQDRAREGTDKRFHKYFITFNRRLFAVVVSFTQDTKRFREKNCNVYFSGIRAGVVKVDSLKTDYQVDHHHGTSHRMFGLPTYITPQIFSQALAVLLVRRQWYLVDKALTLWHCKKTFS